MSALPFLLMVLAATAERPDWLQGDHLTGDWGGRRTTLEERGISVALVYQSESFVSFLGNRHGPTLLGHIDAALSFDSEKLGLWRGGRLYVLGQNNYAANGLGAVLVAQPISWLITRVALFEGSPEVGSLGFDTAFKKGAGFTVVAGAALTHTLASLQGTTSFSFWRQTRADFPERYNWGFFVQHDEWLFHDPAALEDERGLVATVRFSWAMPDRNLITLYGGAAVTWRGIGSRENDSVGLGFGYLGISAPVNGSPDPGSEFFFELFYKMRVTNFFALQPTVQFLRTPGGDGPNALIAGVRFELVL